MTQMIDPKYEQDKIAYLDNDFIRRSTALQPLTELEINLLIYLCYKAKEQVDVTSGLGWSEEITIDMKKFLAGIGYKKAWTDYNKTERQAMYRALKKMQHKTFEVRTPKYIDAFASKADAMVYESYSYVNYLRYDEQKGSLLTSMPQRTQKFLMNYETGFTPVEFRNIIRLHSKYAKILYLLFRSYRDGIDHTDYTLDHLRQVLGLEDKYGNWTDFKRYVFEPAIKEINEKTDICVTGKKDVYHKAMNGRKPENMSPTEHAKIVVDSMALTGARGKSIYKITFRVNKNSKNDKGDELDFSGLIPIATNKKEE